MSAVLEVFPGAQRALFRRYHIGGCASCGFQPTETLAQVCARNGNLDVQEVLTHIQSSHEQDTKIFISAGELAEWRKQDPNRAGVGCAVARGIRGGQDCRLAIDVSGRDATDSGRRLEHTAIGHRGPSGQDGAGRGGVLYGARFAECARAAGRHRCLGAGSGADDAEIQIKFVAVDVGRRLN